MPSAGLEPATSCSASRRSNPLNYEGSLVEELVVKSKRCLWQGSNLQHPDPKSGALSIELQRPDLQFT